MYISLWQRHRIAILHIILIHGYVSNSYDTYYVVGLPSLCRQDSYASLCFETNIYSESVKFRNLFTLTRVVSDHGSAHIYVPL